MSESVLQIIDVGTGPAARRIAVRVRDGAPPGLFWLGGFKSDMKGTKAEALDRWAGERGRARIRFDHSGDGGRQKKNKDKTAGSVAGLVLIAPAVDFTEELMWKNFSPEVRRQIETEG